MTKKVAVVLGGTAPHAELIKELKKRDYHTVVVDYFDNPPAAQFADEHYKESAMDLDVVVDVARKCNADIILSSCLDQQINIAMKAAEILGLKHPFSSETASKVTNKRLMKKIMMDNAIPTAKYYVVDETSDFESLEFKSSVIIKPVDGCGSAGITVLDEYDPQKARDSIALACKYGHSGKAIIEDFITGTEMSVHGYVKDGIAHVLFGTCKIVVMDGQISKQLCNVYIPDLKPALYDNLVKIMNQIAVAFELPANTPLFMQTIVRGDEVFVLEFSPRIGGGISSIVANRYAAFNLLGYSIDSYTGEQTVDSDSKKLKCFVCNSPLYVESGIFDSVSGVDEVLEKGIANDVVLLKSAGDTISVDKPSSSLVMKYIITGKTSDECFNRIQEADVLTDVLDVNGASMRKGKTELTYEIFTEKLSALI